MSPRLRPLQLPLLVEQRRKLESTPPAEPTDLDLPLDSYTLDSSSSDAHSPVTPTFSTRGHLRYASSTSSFEVATPANSESPSSPSQAPHKPGKRSLPDVEEEPVEPQDSDDDFDVLDHADHNEIDELLYNCLCAEPCLHRGHNLVRSASDFYSRGRTASYDIGCMSDGDLSSTLRSSSKSLGGADSPFSGITQRIGSKFPGFTRWKPARHPSLTHSPISEFGFEQRSAISRAASSRSSSISASGRHRLDRTNEPPLPPTPALSFYDSSDSIPLPGAVDIEQVVHLDAAAIERDRALATTPLLPPMMNDASPGPATAQPSPLESPKVAISPLAEPQSPLVMSPPLSTKPSISSFHRIAMSGELPGMQEEDETWCNLLGHANYTIMPLPYKPEVINLESLRQLRVNWDTARTNYTKHLARTGEHYGMTSKIYALTEAKWAETKGVWRQNHDEVADIIVGSGAADSVAKFDEDVPTAVPHIATEGKFPERGDEDIVGPMIREATMLIPSEFGDKKNASFWRSLAGRVGLRK